MTLYNFAVSLGGSRAIPKAGTIRTFAAIYKKPAAVAVTV